MTTTRRIAAIAIALCLAVVAAPVSLACIVPETSRLPCPTGSQATAMNSCDGSGVPIPDPPSSAHRSCPMSSSSSCAAPKEGSGSFRGAEVDRLAGQRQIYRKNLLDNPVRAAVYTTIVANPGIDLTAISRAVLVNRQTLRYHLDLLESHHKIAVVRERGTTRYFENSGRYGAIEQRVFLHLRSPTAHAILALIRSDPGITQSMIAERIGYSAPTIRWHTHRLLDDGIVTAERAGRTTRYHLTAAGSATMHQIAAVPGSMA